MSRTWVLILGSVAAAALLAGFLEIAEGLRGSPELVAFDSTVSAAVQSLRGPIFTGVMVGITSMGDTAALTLAAVALFVVLMREGRRDDALLGAAVLIVGGLISALTKESFARLRPAPGGALVELPLSYAFPSGHTVGSVTFALVAAYLTLRTSWPAPRKAAVVAVLLGYTFLVGISRVYLGVHWPSDVIAGWLLGGAWTLMATTLYEGYRPRASAHEAESR